MTDWVKDLGEQNAMLVNTVHDLEQAAVCRVKLLENKLQATSNLISHNISHPDNSGENLNVLSDRICHIASDQDDMQKKINCLQNDIGSLLELIKRGRIENNWDLDGITFYEVQPSDIPAPTDCTCNEITTVIDNEASACDKKDLQIKKFSEQLHNTEAKMEKLLHEHRCKESELETKISEMCKESENLKKHFACLEKESRESQEALTAEVVQKHDTILLLKNKIERNEGQLLDYVCKLQYKEKVINQLREDLKKDNEKVPITRKVRISTEPCEKVENLTENICLENQNEILAYLINLKASMEKESETFQILKIEYETALKSIKQIRNMYENDVALANEKLVDIMNCLSNYKSEVIEKNHSKDSIEELITTIEKKIIFIEKLFQNNCKRCVTENIESEITDMISKITAGIQKLSELQENKCKITSSIQMIISKNKNNLHKNTFNQKEQEAIFAAIGQQFRMMDEFRICTVEVQAATEDLREEVSEVLSNLNSRHCKYVELNNMVSQIQDYLTKTRENMSEMINKLELQDEERARHSERIINNRIRLKDIKNEFNRTQSELSKCLHSVQNNIQHNNLSGYTEIHMCNDLLISVIEEVEQIVNNLHPFQSQGCCTLSTMTELKNQLTSMDLNVKELKRKSEKILKENETAQKSFVEKLERLEKYECEVDNCHSKMQDVLESIIATRDQMNEFGYIQENQNSFQNTNETIKLKEELRQLHKKCDELKLKTSEESQTDKKEYKVFDWENRIMDLEDHIQVLENEIKCKQQTNIFLKQSVDSLEKELHSTRTKAEDNRRCSSSECLELKKKIFELENSLRVQKDIENNLKCLVNNETDSKKSQLLDYVKDRHNDSSVKYGLQGTNEHISTLFKGLQDTIQTIKSGLQELTDKLKRLVPDGSSHTCSPNTVQEATEILTKYVESIKHCFFEVEKIKAALYSKDKLMENMDKIIRIQKDSITLSQSEVEDVHKTLQEKIDAQEKLIVQIEKENRHLTKQVELQVQTIGHLQDAVVESKRTIDQLSNKAASDNHGKSQIIRSLNLCLSETQSQYDDCYGEASKQGALLDLQREAIGALQRTICRLECDGFFQIFVLHFVYYVVLIKYQDELNTQNRKFADLRSKVKELEDAKIHSEKRCEHFQCIYEEANKEIEKLRCNFKDSCKKLCAEKQCEIDALLADNDDLRQQLQMYKLEFDVIEEEMKKMGIVDQSVESFTIKFDTLRSENEQFRLDVENYKKLIDELKRTNECVSIQFQELKQTKDIGIEKYKEKIMRLQNDIILKNEKIKHLNIEVNENKTMIGKLLEVIDEFNQTDMHRKGCSADLSSSKETIRALQSHIDSLKISLQEKSDHLDKLEKDKHDLKNEYNILKSRLTKYDDKFRNETSALRCKLKQTQSELMECQKNYEITLKNLNKTNGHLSKLAKERRVRDDSPKANSVTCHCDQLSVQKDDKSEEIKKLTKDLEDCREKLSTKSTALSEMQTKYHAISSKCDTFERSYQRQKDDIMLLEKKLGCINQKFQNCKDKNEELIRQNKSFEDSNNKCMAELEDIVLQLEDMQSSLVELRTECDAKSQSLECVSAELARMRVSRSEVCEESKHVLNWLRCWMREQRQAAAELREKLRDRHRRLVRLGSEKRSFVSEARRLKRANRLLAKRLRLVRRPAGRQQSTAAAIVDGCVLPACPTTPRAPVKLRNGLRNGFYASSRAKESNAVYSYFRRECREGPNRVVDKITLQGDCRWLRNLEHLTKEVPRSSQLKINESNTRTERTVHEDTADYGYQTSSSK